MNKTMYVFPGQGAQFVGMGKDLYDHSDIARNTLESANEMLGFSITELMFNGTPEDLKQTKVTQPAIFLHSVALAQVSDLPRPAGLAGHSLGEISALVVGKALSFEDGLRLVSARATAMQAACEANPSTMAAILGLEDAVVEEVCAATKGIVVAANYNCPGQIVISGENAAVEQACETLKAKGAKRALILPVGGAFHSPLMAPATEQLATVIEQCNFKEPIAPVYQNVNALPTSDPSAIKQQLLKQLTSPVRWTQTMHQFTKDGMEQLVEIGPGKVLQGLMKKVDRSFPCSSASFIS